MKKFYQMSLEDVLKEVNSSEEGLTSKEAGQRLSIQGENILKEKKCF